MLAVEQCLNRENLIVQPVSGENDIGRDAYVDVVRGTDVTGEVVALQVKSGPSFRQDDRWVIPGDPQDFTLWRESTVPMFGVVHDPSDESLRWVNLSEVAARDHALPRGDVFHRSVVEAAYGKRGVVVPDDHRLDLDIASFVAEASGAVRRHVGLPALQLLSASIGDVEVAILDTFALGRSDARAFLLLAALLRRIPSQLQRLAVSILAMATRHPDVFWTEGNWIPSEIKSQLHARLKWTADEVAFLLRLVVEDGEGIQRGSFGQHVFHVLELDAGLDARLEWVATDRRAEILVAYYAAVILLYRSEAPTELMRDLKQRTPERWADRHFVELEELIEEHGWVSLF